MFNTKQLQTAHKIIDSLVAYSEVQILHLMYKVEGDYMILDIKEPITKRYSINSKGEWKQLF